MSRRRQSAIEDLIAITARLPWWIAFVIAPLSWFLLHPLTEAPLPKVTNLNEISGLIPAQFIQTAALFGQYILPLVFTTGGIMSAVRAFKARKLFAVAQEHPGTSDLMDITWREFEHLVGESFRQQGFRVAETAPGPDGGVDLELRRDGELYLVQCKRWRAYKVGVEIVRELYGVMAARGAAGGYVITSGVFTREAEEFARGRNIDLWNGAKLKAMIRRNGPSTVSRSASQSAATGVRPIASGYVPEPGHPTCPVCGGEMIQRTAKRGTDAGQRFWGCRGYPKCRGTRPATNS